jgi:hypothetical protein
MHGFAVLTQTPGDPFEAALFRRADPVIQLVGQSFLIMVEKDLIRSTAWTMGDDRSSSAVTNRRSSAVCLSGSPMSRRATLRVLGADTADPWDSLTGRRRLTGGSSRRPSPSQTEGEQGARIMRSSSADRAELPFPVLSCQYLFVPTCPVSERRAQRTARRARQGQAARWRPDEKTVASPIVAASAVAVIGPMPGIVISRWHTASARACAASRASSSPTRRSVSRNWSNTLLSAPSPILRQSPRLQGPSESDPRLDRVVGR